MPAMDMDNDLPVGHMDLEARCPSPMKTITSMSLLEHDVVLEPPHALPIPKLDHDALKEKARKRKKNKKKNMLPAAPALNVIKGFQTPTTPAGEESERSAVSTPLLRATGSPAMRPVTPGSGISRLLASRLENLDLDNDERRPGLSRVMSYASTAGESTTAPSSRTSEGDKTEMETYDVPLDEDFVSLDAGSRTPIFASHATEGGLRTQSVCRKMCADDFENLRCLGKGAFGTVHLVKQQMTGKLYAQKMFKKASLTVHKRLIEQTRTERTILESVNRHPFVVKLYYAFQDHEKLYLILEYAQGGELFTHLSMERMFSESTAAFYMAEIILALQHLHHNVRVIYRDLKYRTYHSRICQSPSVRRQAVLRFPRP
nr:serine/threonine-protein kinase psk1 [Quercus suber]